MRFLSLIIGAIAVFSAASAGIQICGDTTKATNTPSAHVKPVFDNPRTALPDPPRNDGNFKYLAEISAWHDTCAVQMLRQGHFFEDEDGHYRWVEAPESPPVDQRLEALFRRVVDAAILRNYQMRLELEDIAQKFSNVLDDVVIPTHGSWLEEVSLERLNTAFCRQHARGAKLAAECGAQHERVAWLKQDEESGPCMTSRIEDISPTEPGNLRSPLLLSPDGIGGRDELQAGKHASPDVQPVAREEGEREAEEAPANDNINKQSRPFRCQLKMGYDEYEPVDSFKRAQNTAVEEGCGCMDMKDRLCGWISKDSGT